MICFLRIHDIGDIYIIIQIMSNRVNTLHDIKDIKALFCNEAIYIEKMFSLKIEKLLAIYLSNIFVIFLLSRPFKRLTII